jgi:hypothetical protein
MKPQVSEFKEKNVAHTKQHEYCFYQFCIMSIKAN